WGRRVSGDLGVGVEPVLVVVELRVLDHDGPTRVGAGVAECVVLRPRVVDGDATLLLTGTDVLARIVEVAGVGLVPGGRPGRVGGEDTVLGGRVLGAVV